MTGLESATLFKDMTLASAAIFTCIVATRGLGTWQRELRGKANFDAAKGLAKATYGLRDQIQQCRSAMVLAQEFPESYRNFPDKKTSTEKAEAWAHVFKNRWEPVWIAIQEFDVQVLEAEALWGLKIRQKTDVLHKAVRKLHVSMGALIDNEASDGEVFQNDRDFGKKIRADIFGYQGEDNNPLSSEMKSAVTDIENFLRPFLNRS